MKKFLLSGLIIFLTATLSIFNFGCGNNNLVPDRPLHIWSEEWSHDGVSHWHACTDEGCPGKSDNAYHEYELTSTITQPTCSKEGQGVWTCKVCGYTKNDKIDKSEHSLKLSVTTKLPTCYQPGSGIFVCENCGESEEQLIPATGKHVFDTKYTYDETSHWHVCKATYGCTATDGLQPHVEGAPRVIQPAVSSWIDGSKTYYCDVCGAYMREEPIYSKKAPASFDLELWYGSSQVPMTEMEKENGFDCYSVTLVRNREYAIKLANAVNSYGDSVVIGAGDIEWDVPTLHGLHGYYVTDRGNEEECPLYDRDAKVTLNSTLTCNVAVSASNPLKLILRYETGVNDYNYQNRRVRVTKILYVTCVSSVSQNTAYSFSALPVLGSQTLSDWEIVKRYI